MHSSAMAQDILEAVLIEARKKRARHVKSISVKVGDGHFAESGSLQSCLEATAKGTIAEGARIEVKLRGITAMCRECAYVFKVENQLPICPQCGDRNTEILNEEEPLQIMLRLC